MTMFLFSVLLFCAMPILIVLNVIVLPCALTKLADRIWPKQSGKLFSVLPIRLAFDSDQALVWQAQVPVLQLISQSGERGASASCLRKAYRECARHYPEIYEGFTFEQWLRFLNEERLVLSIGKRVVLTETGTAFLHYRLAAHPAGCASLPPSSGDSLRC